MSYLAIEKYHKKPRIYVSRGVFIENYPATEWGITEAGKYLRQVGGSEFEYQFSSSLDFPEEHGCKISPERIRELIEAGWREEDAKISGAKEAEQRAQRLADAAPELLAALKAVVEQYDGDDLPQGNPVMNAARAAIAKAEGRTT